MCFLLTTDSYTHALGTMVLKQVSSVFTGSLNGESSPNINMVFCCYLFSQTTLPDFRESEFSVQREHEEFTWLHTMYDENPDYAGIVVSKHFAVFTNKLGCSFQYNMHVQK